MTNYISLDLEEGRVLVTHYLATNTTEGLFRNSFHYSTGCRKISRISIICIENFNAVYINKIQ